MSTLNDKTRVPLAWFFGFVLICVPVTGWFLHLEWRLDAYAQDKDKLTEFVKSVDRRLKRIQIKMGIQDPPGERAAE